MINIPRGKYIGRRVGNPANDEAEHSFAVRPVKAGSTVETSRRCWSMKVRCPTLWKINRSNPMPLKMRRTGLGHGVYKDVPDYGVFSGEWCIGRIYQTRTGPPDLRWFWALNVASKPLGLRTYNQAATLEAAKAESEASWKQWKAWDGR